MADDDNQGYNGDDNQGYNGDDNQGYNGNDDGSSSSSSKTCMIYDRNDFFTVLVQIMLAFFALACLYIKRLQETPRRNFRTWFLDISKQAFGACYAHVLNMIIASYITQHIRGETVLEDQCAWYGISYLIDTTLGLVLAIVFLRILDWQANERDWLHLRHSGVYSGPDGWKHWVSQSTAWMVILTIVKIIIYVFMWIFSEPLAYFGALLFLPLQGNIRFELLFVMIFFPGFLNVIYFWIADDYLQADSSHSAAHEGVDDKEEALIDDAEATATEGKNYAGTPAWSSLETEKEKVGTMV